MRYPRIRNLREDKDLKQQQVADMLNLTQRAYSHYETGERKIPVEVLSQLANIYNTSIDYLVDKTDVRESYPAVMQAIPA